MEKIIRTARIAALLTLALLLMTVSTAVAAPPLGLHIEVREIIGLSGETFAASGAAVDAGVICPSGTVDDLSVASSGAIGGAYTILHVLKRFHCADPGGTFDLRLVVRLDNATHQTTASWQVVAGTDAYVGLHGNGALVGVPVVPGYSIDDYYDGKVH